MCLFPTKVEVSRAGKWQDVPVPCGHCWQCRSNHVSDFVGRCLCESSVSDWTVTLTLTYADRADLADKLLTPRHFQKFIRSMRKRGHSLRYLVAGEYGALKARAHFHCVLFGRGRPPDLPHKRRSWLDAWPHGHVYADWGVDDRSIRYVCKYVLKGARSNPDGWFSMSKKPPLGHAWFLKKAQQHVDSGVLPSSFEYFPPGGQKGRPYMMTGAVRRDFLAAVVDGWRDSWPFDYDRCSDWVLASMAKADLLKARSDANEYANSLSCEDFLALWRTELDRRRLKPSTVLHQVLDPVAFSEDGRVVSAKEFQSWHVEDQEEVVGNVAPISPLWRSPDVILSRRLRPVVFSRKL